MIEFNYLLPIGLSLALMTAGIVVMFFPRPKEIPRLVFCAIGGVVAGAAMLLLMGLLLFSPSLRQRREWVSNIITANVLGVTQIEIMPLPRGGIPTLVTRPIVVTNAAEIAKVTGTLSKAKSFSPNHPQAEWNAVVRLTMKSGVSEFEVSKSPDPTNGTYISVWSNGTDGWPVDFLRSDGLAPILERLAKP